MSFSCIFIECLNVPIINTEKYLTDSVYFILWFNHWNPWMFFSKRSNTTCLLKSLFREQMYPKLQMVKYTTHSFGSVDRSNYKRTRINLTKIANTLCIYCIRSEFPNVPIINRVEQLIHSVWFIHWKSNSNKWMYLN